MHHDTVNIEETMAARRVLIGVLRAEAIFPGPIPPTLWRSVGIDSEKSDPRVLFIQVVLPVAEEVSDIPNGVRVVVVQDDRKWIAQAL
jgi:hypothetical protein